MGDRKNGREWIYKEWRRGRRKEEENWSKKKKG